MPDNFRVSAIVDHNTSYNNNHNSIPPIIQGKQRVRKPNNLPILGSNSSLSNSSSSPSCVVENLSVSSRLPAGTTMKKLLSDEMKKESESGRRQPSIIANLMGLDWLPAQQNASRQRHKRVSDDYQKKCNSVGSVRSGKGNESRSQRKYGKGEQKYGDVYECMESGSVTSRGGSYRNGSDEDDIAFVRQKFIDVKRFSTDEKLRHSKEFHDALEVLNSNKDLLLKFLQEPNSLFTKHLQQLHGARDARSECVEGLKSSNNFKSNVDVIGYHSGGTSSKKIDISHSRNGSNGSHSELYRRHNVGSHKLVPSSGGKEDPLSIATRIVVLKPNLGKARNTGRSISSTTPSRDLVPNDEFQNGCSNKMQLGPEMKGRRGKHDDLDFCGEKSRESRELARDVTRKMKNRLGVDSFNVSSYGYKGYSADESSSDMSDNNSSYESEVTVIRPTTSLNRGIHNKPSPSSLTSPHMESSISREAKRRLSRRWKMANKAQEVGPSGKGSTLAEMLAVPDGDIRALNLDYVSSQDEHLRKFGRVGETSESMTPFGISSRDGWKDGRFRSLSASSSQPGSPRNSTRHETITPERFLVRTRSLDSGKNRSFKRDSERKERSFSESTRSKNKECQSTCVGTIDDIDIPSSVNLVTNGVDGKDSPDIKSVIIEVASCKHVALSEVVDTENVSVSKSLNCPDEIVSTSTTQSSVLPRDDRFFSDVSSAQQEPSTCYDAENSPCLQFSVTQSKSPSSSKESEQPSPVSVLEAPFIEEVSSGSECFERVSEELHGLRMQLQLLKQESEVYDEGSMLVSSDECEEESTELDNEIRHDLASDSWQSSYLLDMLTYSGIDAANPGVFLDTWHSPNCPIGPRVFDNLENKYGKRRPCLRSERKLLFDRINSGIVQFFSQYVNVGPSLKSLRNVTRQWRENGLKSELHYLLENHERVATENMMDAAILSDMEWFKLGDHLDDVGSDIERSLLDELAAEFVSL